MYAVVLRYDLHPQLRMINQAHQFVMEHTAQAMGWFANVEISGISDLSLGTEQRKCSGNSLRCKRKSLLYHGTLLYDFPLELIQQCLAIAPRQPEYRQGREHESFVANLPADANSLRQQLIRVWKANQPMEAWPVQRTQQLVQERYRLPQWNRLKAPRAPS